MYKSGSFQITSANPLIWSLFSSVLSGFLSFIFILCIWAPWCQLPGPQRLALSSPTGCQLLWDKFLRWTFPVSPTHHRAVLALWVLKMRLFSPQLAVGGLALCTAGQMCSAFKKMHKTSLCQLQHERLTTHFFARATVAKLWACS